MQENLLSLDDVKSHFEHWRLTRTKRREKIPQYLWDEVKTLIDRYSLMDITSTLRVNTGQIKDNLKINQAKINFAEVKIDELNSLQHSHLSDLEKTKSFSIELHRANGVILKINELPALFIQKIITQLME